MEVAKVNIIWWRGHGESGRVPRVGQLLQLEIDLFGQLPNLQLLFVAVNSGTFLFSSLMTPRFNRSLQKRLHCEKDECLKEKEDKV